MLEIIKSFFSPVGGGRTSFASQNGNIQRKEDLRQGRNLVSNSDFNRKRGEEYLKSSYGRFADGSNASVLISSSFASENIVGGGQLRSNKIKNASSRSIYGCNSVVSSIYYVGGEGLINRFADTSIKTMFNASELVFGGGHATKISTYERGQAV